MALLGVVTHLFWILSVLAAVIVIATIVAFVQAWQERERRRAFSSHSCVGRSSPRRGAFVKGADQYCTICRLPSRNPSRKEKGDRLRF
jgi:hypothetical protein